MGYREAYEEQCRRHEGVLAGRAASPGEGASGPGVVLLVEHDPVITVTGRPGAAAHVLAAPETLRRAGVVVERTDRGGDVTYHGPGQLVVYPILDLNALNLGLHDYMRLLEESVIRACASWGLDATRDPSATGVWVEPHGERDAPGPRPGAAKIAAMGVRVKRWVSLHGLALNVDPDLAHFGMIVPCGLAGRGVTSLARELGAACPSMGEAKAALARELVGLVDEARARAMAARGDGVRA